MKMGIRILSLGLALASSYLYVDSAVAFPNLLKAAGKASLANARGVGGKIVSREWHMNGKTYQVVAEDNKFVINGPWNKKDAYRHPSAPKYIGHEFPKTTKIVGVERIGVKENDYEGYISVTVKEKGNSELQVYRYYLNRAYDNPPGLKYLDKVPVAPTVSVLPSANRQAGSAPGGAY